jgi:predicted HTH transcriptional regulator
MPELTDAEILLRLTNTEDSTVERKTAADFRDCLKTAVAFSNSLPIGDPGIIFVGVFDDGRVEDKNNIESLQIKVSGEINKIYPPICSQMKALEKDAKMFLAVIVRGSDNRPHFAGQSFVRDGTQTVLASSRQFERLIAERSTKTYTISKWIGQAVTLQYPAQEYTISGTSQARPGPIKAVSIRDCNNFYVSFEN